MNVLMFPPGQGSGLGEQYRQTLAALAAHNVQSTIAGGVEEGTDPHQGTLSGANNAGAYDAVHLWDAPDSLRALASFVRARALGAPVVVSPIYWNPDRFYEQGLPAADPPQGAQAELEIELRAAERTAQRVAQRVLFCHAALLIPLSASEAGLLERDFGVQPERMHVAPNGVNPLFVRGTRADSAGQTSGALAERVDARAVVLCAARFEIRKNQLALIQALRDEPVTLVFAGQVLAPGYLELCRRAAHGGRVQVQWPTPLAPGELASAYAAARVHALVSWFDCAPLTPLEAAAAGCAIVMTTESGARDYFGADATYCDPARPEEIRAAVCTALAGPPPTLHEHITREYTWARAAAETHAAYERAREMGNPTGDAAYAADLEEALVALADLTRLQQEARGSLWQTQAVLARTVAGYANGRVMRALHTAEQMQHALGRWLKR